MWLRHSIVGGEITPKGKVHRAFLRKLQPPKVTAAWTAEISGRAFSLAYDVKERATAVVQQQRAKNIANGKDPEQFKLRGFIFCFVHLVRQVQLTKCDVVIQKTPDDHAHANFVVFRWPLTIEDEDKLLEYFEASGPDDSRYVMHVS